MYTTFLVLIMIVAVLLILIIMVQNPKGGGLSSSFGGGGASQSLGGGVQSTTNFLDKSTWVLAIALLALILLSNFAIPRANNAPTGTTIEKTLENRDVQDAPAIEQPATKDTVK